MCPLFRIPPDQAATPKLADKSPPLPCKLPLLMIKRREIEDGKTITAVLLAAAHPLLAAGVPAAAEP